MSENLPVRKSVKQKVSKYPMVMDRTDNDSSHTKIRYHKAGKPVWAAENKIGKWVSENRSDADGILYFALPALLMGVSVLLAVAILAIIGVPEESLNPIMFSVMHVSAGGGFFLVAALDILGRNFKRQEVESFTTISIDNSIDDNLKAITDESFKKNMFNIIRNFNDMDFDSKKLLDRILRVWRKLEKAPDSVKSDLQEPLRVISRTFPESRTTIVMALNSISDLENKVDSILNKINSSKVNEIEAKDEVEREEITKSFERALKIATEEDFIRG